MALIPTPRGTRTITATANITLNARGIAIGFTQVPGDDSSLWQTYTVGGNSFQGWNGPLSLLTSGSVASSQAGASFSISTQVRFTGGDPSEDVSDSLSYVPGTRTIEYGADYAGNVGSGFFVAGTRAEPETQDGWATPLDEQFDWTVSGTYSYTMILREVYETGTNTVGEELMAGSKIEVYLGGGLIHRHELGPYFLQYRPVADVKTIFTYSAKPPTVTCTQNRTITKLSEPGSFGPQTPVYIGDTDSATQSCVLTYGAGWINPSMPTLTGTGGSISWGSVTIDSVDEGETNGGSFSGIEFDAVYFASSGSTFLPMQTLHCDTTGSRFGIPETDPYDLSPLSYFPQHLTLTTAYIRKITGNVGGVILSNVVAGGDTNTGIAPTNIGNGKPYWRIPVDPIPLRFVQAAEADIFAAGSWVVGTGSTDRDKWYADTGGTTLSISGSALRLVKSTAGSATAAYRLDLGKKMSYRYLRVRCRSVGSANRAITFTLDSTMVTPQTSTMYAMGTVTTGADGVWVEREIDLRIAYNSDYFGGFGGTFQNQIRYFNPQQIIFTISGVGTVEIEEIVGFRKNETLLSVTAGASANLAQVHAFTDGWLSLTLPNSLQTIAQWCSGYPEAGWSIEATDTSYGFDLTDVELAYFALEGGGRFVRQSDNSLEPDAVFDRDAKDTTVTSGTPNIWAAAMSTIPSDYPLCGDIDNAGAYGDETTLNMVAMTGIAAAGVFLMTGTGNSSSGTLRMENSAAPSTLYGSGSTGTDGFAATGAPYFSTAPTAAIVGGRLLTEPAATTSRTFLPGGTYSLAKLTAQYTFNKPAEPPTDYIFGSRYWTVFNVVPPSALWISMDASATGRLVQATTNSAGKIVLRFPSVWGVGTWDGLVTTITGARPVARFAHQRANGELVLLYETSGGAIQRVTTANEGGTFSVAVTITSAGKYPAADLTPTGAEAIAWWVTGGAIKFRTYDAYGSPLKAEVTAVASGVAEDAIALTCHKSGVLVLAYRNTSGSIITVTSVNGGETWT